MPTRRPYSWKKIPIDSVVVQGDILPVINYLQYKGRIKKPAVVAILEQCLGQGLPGCSPCGLEAPACGPRVEI